MGWFDNNFHEWHSHEWKLLANWPTSDQKITILVNLYIILFLTCIINAKAQKNRWNLLSINWRAPVYIGSVSCGIMILGKYLLWRHCHWPICFISKWVTCIFLPLSSWLSLINYLVRFTTFSMSCMLEIHLVHFMWNCPHECHKMLLMIS